MTLLQKIYIGYFIGSYLLTTACYLFIWFISILDKPLAAMIESKNQDNRLWLMVIIAPITMPFLIWSAFGGKLKD